jgi:hypothetical protein
MTKKTDGTPCSSFTECASSICGGRCCSAPCTCPQPSPQNLFINAGFDADISGWGTVGVQWVSDDADGCPFSGSAKILGGNGNPSRDVNLSPGTFYRFGGSFKVTPGGIVVCQLTLDDGTVVPGLVSTSASWSSLSESVQTGPAVSSAHLFCDGAANTFVDKLFLTPEPPGIF